MILARPRSRCARTAVALAAALLVSAYSACSTSDARDSIVESNGPGPILEANPHGWSYTTETGSVFTDGLETLTLTEDATATIDAVELVEAEGLELIGAKIAPPPRPLSSTALVKRWPPVQKGSFDEKTLVDAVGATFGMPDRHHPMGWELLLGIRVVGEGHLHREGVRVRYHIGDKNYVVTIPAELAICTDKSFEERGMCPFDVSD